MFFTILLVIFVIDVLMLIPLILLQSGSGAQSGLFGSDFALGAFGAKTSEVMVRLTKWCVTIFMATAFLMGWVKIQENKQYIRQTQRTEQQQTETPAATTVTADTNATNSIIISTNLK